MPGRRLDELIARQQRRWAIERGEGMPQSRGPSVAISRLRGSGGAVISERVAEWLDYGLFGVDVVDRIAALPEVVEQLSEGLAPATCAAIDARVEAVLAGGVDDAALRTTVRIVATLGERGMAVFLGRGAAAILPAERTLRVLVIAPDDERIARQAADDVSSDVVRRSLVEGDAARAEFLTTHFGASALAPTAFDLVVNTGHLSIDAAAALVVDGLRRRFPPTTGPGA